MNAAPPLESLLKVGFSDKEAQVYLAALDLGPSPVQAIAERAGLKRPTAYLMLESLQRRGLMTTFKAGKKSLYRVSPPQALKYIYSQRRSTLEKRGRAIKGVIDSLNTISDHKNGIIVRFLDGQKATPVIQDMALAAKEPTMEVVNIKRARSLGPVIYDGDKRQAIIKRGNYKAVAYEEPGYHRFPGSKSLLIAQGRYVAAQLWMVDNHAFFNYKRYNGDKLHINNVNMATTLKSMFEALHDEAGRTAS